MRTFLRAPSVFALVGASGLVLAFAACGGGDSTGPAATSGGVTATSSASTSSSGTGGSTSSSTSTTSSTSSTSSASGGAGGSGGASTSTGAGGGCSVGADCESGICKAGQCASNLVTSFEWPGNALDQIIVSRPDGTYVAAGGQLEGGNPANGLTTSIVNSDGTLKSTFSYGDAIGFYMTGVRDVVNAGAGEIVVGRHNGDQLNFKGNLSFPKNASACPYMLSLNGGVGFAKLFCNQESDLPTNTQVHPDVAVDGKGNIWLMVPAKGPIDFGGGPMGAANATSTWLAEFKSDGTFLEAQALGGAGCYIDDLLNDGYANRGTLSPIVGLADGVAIAAELTGAQCDFGGGKLPFNFTTYIAVARFSGAGAHVWSHSFFGKNAATYAPLIAADASDGVYLTAYTNYGGGMAQGVDLGAGPIDAAGMIDAKLDGAAGTLAWGDVVGGSKEVQPSAFTALPGGGVAIAGLYKATPQFKGAFDGPMTNGSFLVKFSSAGDYIWGRGYDPLAYPNRLDIDAQGLVGMTGTYQGATVDFGAGPLPKPCGGFMCSPLFVAKFQLP